MAILNASPSKLAREEALEARDRALQAAAENTVLYEQMRHMALTDPLTGLSTRRHFFNKAANAFEWAMKHNQILSAIMVDIDHLNWSTTATGTWWVTACWSWCLTAARMPCARQILWAARWR